jgi:hypothetical protein
MSIGLSAGAHSKSGRLVMADVDRGEMGREAGGAEFLDHGGFGITRQTDREPSRR